jgi:PIN domain
VLRFLIDTSVWLDLAKRRNGQRWIVPLRVLTFQKKLELLVPSLVIHEFERNRPRAEAAVTSSVLDRFRELRNDLHEYGGDERLQWLEAMAHQVPMVSSGTLQNFSEISDLLRTGSRLEPSSTEIDAAMSRGLEKRAPFHLNKNSTADALIIELYGAALRDARYPDAAHCFVTSNYVDFSIPNGDRRAPHPDIAAFFTDQRSDYFYGVDGLDTALVNNLGVDFIEEAEETELVHEEPRTLAEILEAEKEFFDKIWYVRKLILREKIKAGEHESLGDEMDEQMDNALRAIEERYGADNVGPWDDWGWGFVHGKLSALRWALGSEWDFLDT